MISLKNFYSKSVLVNTFIRHYSLTSDDKTTLARTILEKSYYPKMIAYKIFKKVIDPRLCSSAEKNKIWNIVKKEQISLVQNTMTQIYLSRMLKDMEEKDISFLKDIYNLRHDEIVALFDELAEIKIKESEEVFSKEINQRKQKNYEALLDIQNSYIEFINANEKSDFSQEFKNKELNEIDDIAEETISQVFFESSKLITLVLDKTTLARTILEKSHYPKMIAYKIFKKVIDPSLCSSAEKNKIWNIVKKEQISLVQNTMTQIYLSRMLKDMEEKDVIFLTELYNQRHDEVLALVDELAEIKIQESKEVFSKEINQRKQNNFEQSLFIEYSFIEFINANEKSDFSQEFKNKELNEIDDIAEETISQVFFESSKLIKQTLSSEYFDMHHLLRSKAN